MAAPANTYFGTTILKRATEDALDGKVSIDYDAGGLTWSVVAPAEERPHDREIGLAHSGDVPPDGHVDRVHRGASTPGYGATAAAPPSGATGPGPGVVAHDQRAGRQVAEALVAVRQEHRDHPDGVERRQEVDRTDEVAHRRGEQPDRSAVVGDQPKSRQPTARRAAPGEGVERGGHDEQHDEQGQARHRHPRRAQHRPQQQEWDDGDDHQGGVDE